MGDENSQKDVESLEKITQMENGGVKRTRNEEAGS